MASNERKKQEKWVKPNKWGQSQFPGDTRAWKNDSFNSVMSARNVRLIYSLINPRLRPTVGIWFKHTATIASANYLGEVVGENRKARTETGPIYQQQLIADI